MMKMAVTVKYVKTIERIAVSYPLNQHGLKEAEQKLVADGYRVIRKGPVQARESGQNKKIGIMIGERDINEPAHVAMIGEEQVEEMGTEGEEDV